MGSSVNTNFNETNNATQNVKSNVEHNIENNNTYNDNTEEGHLYKQDFIAGNFNQLDRTVNSGHQVFHLMNLETKDIGCEHDYNCFDMTPVITDDGQAVLHKWVSHDIHYKPVVKDDGKLTVVSANIAGIDLGGMTVEAALLMI